MRIQLPHWSKTWWSNGTSNNNDNWQQCQLASRGKTLVLRDLHGCFPWEEQARGHTSTSARLHWIVLNTIGTMNRTIKFTIFSRILENTLQVLHDHSPAIQDIEYIAWFNETNTIIMLESYDDQQYQLLQQSHTLWMKSSQDDQPRPWHSLWTLPSYGSFTCLQEWGPLDQQSMIK